MDASQSEEEKTWFLAVNTYSSIGRSEFIGDGCYVIHRSKAVLGECTWGVIAADFGFLRIFSVSIAFSG